MRPDSTPTPTPTPTPDLPYLALALALSLGAAVSLGVTRFAYGLLLPPMRADLQWSYPLAGAMNTANALGYLLGALAAPRLMARYGPSRLTVAGALLSRTGWVRSSFECSKKVQTPSAGSCLRL